MNMKQLNARFTCKKCYLPFFCCYVTNSVQIFLLSVLVLTSGLHNCWPIYIVKKSVASEYENWTLIRYFLEKLPCNELKFLQLTWKFFKNVVGQQKSFRFLKKYSSPPSHSELFFPSRRFRGVQKSWAPKAPEGGVCKFGNIFPNDLFLEKMAKNGGPKILGAEGAGGEGVPKFLGIFSKSLHPPSHS